MGDEMAKKKRKSPRLKNFGGKRCSEQFSKAFVGTSRRCILCEACGRVHYSEYKNAYTEPGEYKDLVKCHKAEPERYIPHLEEGIYWGYILGQQVVDDCPCGYPAFIEEKIWNDRFVIMPYFKSRAEREAKNANETLLDAQAADAAVQTT